MARLNDPETVAAIVGALRHVHGDDIARFMLTNGTTLAALIDALLHAPLKNSEAAKLISRALRSGDFVVSVVPSARRAAPPCACRSPPPARGRRRS